MNDFFKVIADIDELKWFFDHLVEKPLDGESYMICHSARSKHMTPEERKEYGANRSEMFHTEISKKILNREYKWNDFLALVSKLETSRYAYITENGYLYKDNMLVSYLYLNPCSEAACAWDTLERINTINKDLFSSALKGSTVGVNDSVWKLSTISNHIKACHAQNPSRKVWIDFDIDCETPDDPKFPQVVYSVTKEVFGFKKFFLVKTTGGIHAVVKKEALKFNPNLYTNMIVDELKKIGIDCKEAKKNDNCMIPCAGTYQYGNPVVILNKEDFE